MAYLIKFIVCFIAGIGAGLGTGFAGMSAAAVISHAHHLFGHGPTWLLVLHWPAMCWPAQSLPIPTAKTGIWTSKTALS